MLRSKGMLLHGFCCLLSSGRQEASEAPSTLQCSRRCGVTPCVAQVPGQSPPYGDADQGERCTDQLKRFRGSWAVQTMGVEGAKPLINPGSWVGL